MLLLLISSALGAVETLNMHVNVHRFLNKDRQTIIHLDYQIPYRNLMFQAHMGGYFAEVEFLVEVVRNDSVLFNRSVTDNIGISNKEDSSSDKSYLNRLSFLLDDDYQFRIRALDLNSQRLFVWTLPAQRLPGELALSDLELCVEVRPDSSAYLEKYHRGKMLYRTNPSLIFDKNITDHVYLYFEVYSSSVSDTESDLIVLTVEKDGELISDDYIDFIPRSDVEGITLKIPITDLKDGKYTGYLTLQQGEHSEEREFEFFVTQPKVERFFLFANPDDDFNLLKYFWGNRLTGDWKNFSDEAKRNYISQLWRNWANSNNIPVQTALDIIRERVDYSNKYYSFFNPGWTTDMGRIHIRNGKPDEVDKDTTSDETRYVRKDYQIWKYRGRINAVYVFVDIQMNGNYKLVYVQNDDMESSHPDYRRYLGDDFDTSKLYN